MGIDFVRASLSSKMIALLTPAQIKQCLTIDPMLRPSAQELMNHPWMLDFREQLQAYEEAEMENPPTDMPPEDIYESATVAHAAAIAQERENEDIIKSPETSPIVTPESSIGGNSAPVSPDEL
jgi:mitogen-activated protein kinase kinase kinase